MNLRRILLGVGANAFDKIVIAAVQLLLVPVFALTWGVPTYGAWVLLATAPSFLALSDLGFGTAAGTRMTMLVAQDRRDEAGGVFQSAWAMILISSAALVGLALAAAVAVPDHFLPTSPRFLPADARLTLVLLLGYGIVALQGGIFNAALRSDGRYALSTLWFTATVAFEHLGVIAVVLLGGEPPHAAAALLFCRAAAICGQYLLIRSKLAWLRIGIAEASRSEISLLVRPALAAMALPVGQASQLHGTTVALGAAIGPAAVPAFTAMRTLSRVGLQAAQLVDRAMMPEFSAAIARDDRRSQATMLLGVLFASGMAIAPFAVALALFGESLVALWTRNAIHPDRLLVVTMAAALLLAGFWNPLSNLVLAANRHAGYTYPYLLIAAATIPTTFLLAPLVGPAAAAIATLFLDAAMCAVVFRLGRTVFVDRAELRAARNVLTRRIRSAFAGRIVRD